MRVCGCIIYVGPMIMSMSGLVSIFKRFVNNNYHQKQMLAYHTQHSALIKARGNQILWHFFSKRMKGMMLKDSGTYAPI